MTTSNAPSLSLGFLLRRIGILVLMVVAIAAITLMTVRQLEASDPYVRDVLALTGDATQGHAIFQMNCAGCHGLNASGHVGPSLHHVSDRKSRPALIRQVISGKTPPMPQFQPSPQVMADLLRYLESL